MVFVVFVGGEEIICEGRSDVALALIGLYSPMMEIPHQIEQIMDRAEVPA